MSTPTLIWFQYGQFFPYTGLNMQSKTIIEYINAKTGPGYKTIDCDTPVTTKLNLVYFGSD